MKYYDYTNAELWNLYNASEVYDAEMCAEICLRVGMDEEYLLADGDNIDHVMEEAAERLKNLK